MNADRFAFLVCAFALSQFALAAGVPSSRELGGLQGVYDFCSGVDPKQGRDFDKEASSLYRNLNPKQIAAVRQSGEFKQGYQTIFDVLGELPRDQALGACAGISGEPPKPAGHSSRPSDPEPSRRQ